MTLVILGRALTVWRALSMLTLACVASACASGRAVPRPFPGAPPPPEARPAAARPPAGPEVAPPVPEGPAVAEAPPAAAPAAVSPPVLSTALSLRGTPYRNGGNDPSGFDCSGFVRYVFAQHGRTLPREVRDQFGTGDPIARDEVRPGDLVFFETVSRGASHVGIALDGESFVHAPSSRGGVRVEKYTSEYWAKRWVGARRIVSRT